MAARLCSVVESLLGCGHAPCGRVSPICFLPGYISAVVAKRCRLAAFAVTTVSGLRNIQLLAPTGTDSPGGAGGRASVRSERGAELVWRHCGRSSAGLLALGSSRCRPSNDKGLPKESWGLEIAGGCGGNDAARRVPGNGVHLWIICASLGSATTGAM
jgi:hypothetical protein